MSRLGGRLLDRSFFTGPSFQRASSPVRQLTQSNIQPLDLNIKFEEETHPGYTAENSYPVNIGEVFQSRYQVIGKPGFGGYSTFINEYQGRQHKYVTLKVFERDSTEGKREVGIYDHINSVKASHDGAMFVRTALDTFQIGDAKARYQHPGVFRRWCFLPNTLFLDIQERNTMLGIEDESVLAEFEQAEKSNPSPRKVVGDRVIYASRELKKTNKHGRPVLWDFGQARFGSAYHEKVDIWNLAVVTWDLFQQGHLFYARDSNKEHWNAPHIAEMMAILGPSPKEMLLNNDYAKTFFDSDANWKGAAPISSTTLQQRGGNLQGEQQQLFLVFMRKMLQCRQRKEVPQENSWQISGYFRHN
ncbi:hypothetical protein N7457_006588 [Penicillium paradoxum]|uniref:uncharacterized protein n=1 Tax=Penicillium paradoxum TaxID=176176 RepID=UPI0025484D0D|nr:uncharacterized protein N7457_006588 [Penicillium paradoxum]KAJ5778868.1 hypothetical protein N7457_006588 [Penicillium paradoxum]